MSKTCNKNDNSGRASHVNPLIIDVMKVNSSLPGCICARILKRQITVGVAAIIAAVFLSPVILTRAADTNAPASSATNGTVQTSPTQTTGSLKHGGKAKLAKKGDPKKEKRQLSGAELYAVNCNRCHPERDPSEFTAAQWKTMMIYMRVRANLPAGQARAITRYLEDQAGQ